MRSLLFSCILFGITGTAIQANASGIDIDVVFFYGDDSLTYTEVHVGVQKNALLYSPVGADSMMSRFSIVLSIGRNDTTERSDTLDVEDMVPRSERFSDGAYFPNVFRYLLYPGEFDLSAELLQDGTQVTGKAEMPIAVPAIAPEHSISGIALGAELQYRAESSPFTKNGIQFVPNPSKFYGSGLPMLYYYFECYGLPEAGTQDSVVITRNILTAETGKPARQPSVKTLPVPGTSIVVADGFPAYTLRTGTYVLDMTVSFTGQPDRKATKKFFVYRPEDLSQGRDYALDGEIAAAVVAGGDDILKSINPDSALSLMLHVLTKQDMRRARDMDSEGKRRFMLDYWKTSRPEEPDAANTYFARVAEANQRYSFLNRDGWKTDRGRVYILYGDADYVDRRYADAAGLDHEIWYYDQLEGGVMFIFVDRAGFGDLDLVHSTKRGEIYNPNALYSEQNQNPKIDVYRRQNRGLR